MRGALIAAVIGLIAIPFLAFALILLGKPLNELVLMFAEGVILGAIGNGVHAYMKQKDWQT